jgi:hypothetical protein
MSDSDAGGLATTHIPSASAGDFCYLPNLEQAHHLCYAVKTALI